ncbi:MAG: rod shape-determining protein MreD [Lachnospiraceae bacterium]|nr:rod shape-determining protein MreD [Lachnospiraceae bacterium]
MKKRIFMLVLIFISFCLQCTLFKALSLGKVGPNLLLMLTSIFGFTGGKKDGMFAGFFAGLFTDILYGNGLIGFFMLLFVWAGFVNGMFNTLFYPEDIKLPLILTTFSDFIAGFLTYVFLFLLRSRLDLGFYTVHVILPETVYTLVVTIILYKPVLFLSGLFDDDASGERKVKDA